MKKLFAFGIICSVLFCLDASSAPRGNAAVGGGVRGRTPVAATQSTTKTTSGTTSARAAVSARGAGQSLGVSGNEKRVSARAATTQKAINSGTKIAGATENTVVSDECKTKYYGCMDSFCMLENANGGRCLCSNRNAELEKALEEIQKLDEQSYAMATSGVERINMGENADAVDEIVGRIRDDIDNPDANKNKSRRTLNLGSFDSISTDYDDLFAASSNDVSNLKGDALYASVSDVCVKQIPECSEKISLLKMMYAQQIKSDCTAYENSLKQQKNAATKKLQTAQTALREAALEQYQNANKYDLSQCTIRFKQCMQNTAGCGDDFSKCASVSAIENVSTRSNSKKKTKTYTIQGAMASITIAASTYDTLEAKKTMCESVTKQCVAVKDKVWDAFLREAAPELKSAELIAESNLRTSCISNISKCFQNACKDNIDPNDPDGSYDLCLSRPETVRSLCKVEIEPCVSIEPKILDYVYARLASMRVDACTKEVKSCLTDNNRCGKDYANCIGLDTDTIINMCPSEKLTACNVDEQGRTLSQSEVYNNIETLITGLMLNIDNSFLTQCQNAVNEAMLRVCGDTETCDNLVVDDNAGKRSFKYEVCAYNSIDANGMTWAGKCYDSLDGIPLSALTNPGSVANGAQGWAGKLSGTVYWGDIEYESDDDGKFHLTTMDDYIEKLENAGHAVSPDEKQIIHDRVFGTEIRQLESSINKAINAIESDPVVQFCMTGREVQGMRGADGKIKKFGGTGKDYARFPELTTQLRQIIALSAITNARENYLKKYDEEIERMMQDQVKAAQKMDAQAAQDDAFQTCADWATNSALPYTKTPKSSNAGKWIAVGVLVAASVVAAVFTFGAGGVAGAAAITTVLASGSTATISAGTVATAAMVATAAGAAGVAAGVDDTKAKAGGGNVNRTAGSSTTDQWNYKMTVNTIFSPSTGECTKVTVSQNCKKTKKNYCKEWADPKQTTKTIKLL